MDQGQKRMLKDLEAKQKKLGNTVDTMLTAKAASVFLVPCNHFSCMSYTELDSLAYYRLLIS